jgi:soluble lytic murein transglycosylase-like protein
MARAMMFVGGLVCGVLLTTSLAVSHADDVQAEVLAAASAAHVSPVDLAGAVATTGLDPYTYLRSTGELPTEHTLPPSTPNSPAASTSGVFSSRVACIIAHESEGNPNAHNRSGASGLGQFLPGTWSSTPQGKAGMSVYNPAANTAAITWMIANGRAREFDAVRFYGC